MMQPYLIGHARVSRPLLEAAARDDLLFLDVLAPESLAFYRLLNAANNLAFGGLGMPAWVQLDCCTLPSAMIGFAQPRRELAESLWGSLTAQVGNSFGLDAARALSSYEGPVPVSEYCATPTWESGTVVGFSLFSIVHGHGLGVRTKALAMRCYGARKQIGITQYNNSALRTHTRLGPLRITAARAWPHTRPDDTFVYELELPETGVLDRLVDGNDDRTESAFDFEVPATRTHVEDLIGKHGPLAVVTPGLIVRDGQTALRLRRAA